jgi:hypothetical protein
MAVTDKEKKYPDWWYQSANQEEINALAGQIASRPAFQFKVDHEALYNYYKGEYDRQGREAKMDTQAKIAGLTGGHDNSYARRAGQQVYEGQMALLQEDVAPDLWQMALDKYTREGDALVDRYTTLQKQEEKDRKAWEKEYKDEIEAWEKEQAAAPEAMIDRIQGEEMRYDPMAQYTKTRADAYESKFGVSLPNVFTPHSKVPQVIGDGMDDRLSSLENNGYSVTNYTQAVSRLRNMGVYDHVVQNLLSEKDFSDVQKENQRALETNEGTYNSIVGQYSTYAEYLRGYLTMAERAMANKRPGYTGNYVTGTGGRYGTTGGAM